MLAKDLEDLKKRLGSIFVGYTYDKKPIYAKYLKAQGAMAALLKDALKPNLVQTLEGNPVIIHGLFPILHKELTLLWQQKMGMSLADYTVTEAGFGFDLGGEKFLDIKCQSADLKPKVVVLTATIRALKYHGGAHLKELTFENFRSFKKRLTKLRKAP